MPIGWIDIKFSTDGFGPHRMNLSKGSHCSAVLCFYKKNSKCVHANILS